MIYKRLKLKDGKLDYSKSKWTEQDAFKYSHLIKGEFQKRFDFVDKKLSPDGAMKIKRTMTSMAENLLVIAHSELIAYMREDLTNRKLKSKKEK